MAAAVIFNFTEAVMRMRNDEIVGCLDIYGSCLSDLPEHNKILYHQRRLDRDLQLLPNSVKIGFATSKLYIV